MAPVTGGAVGDAQRRDGVTDKSLGGRNRHTRFVQPVTEKSKYPYVVQCQGKKVEPRQFNKR